jgi:hypothetical protein
VSRPDSLARPGDAVAGDVANTSRFAPRRRRCRGRRSCRPGAIDRCRRQSRDGCARGVEEGRDIRRGGRPRHLPQVSGDATTISPTPHAPPPRSSGRTSTGSSPCRRRVDADRDSGSTRWRAGFPPVELQRAELRGHVHVVGADPIGANTRARAAVRRSSRAFAPVVSIRTRRRWVLEALHEAPTGPRPHAPRGDDLAHHGLDSAKSLAPRRGGLEERRELLVSEEMRSSGSIRSSDPLSTRRGRMADPRPRSRRGRLLVVHDEVVPREVARHLHSDGQDAKNSAKLAAQSRASRWPSRLIAGETGQSPTASGLATSGKKGSPSTR